MEVDKGNANTLDDPTQQPAKRKHVKPEILKKLLKQVFANFCNPNAIGALYALFEKESFKINVTDLKNMFRATLYIDGLVFESTAVQKKKARNDVATKALMHLFSDILNKETEIVNEKLVPNNCDNKVTLSNITSEKCAQPIPISNNEIGFCVRPYYLDTVSKTSTEATLQSVAKCDKLHASYQCDGNVEKRAKKDHAECADPHLLPPKRKEIKSNILERVVKQALGIEECQNPNTITALFTLFERDSFFFEIVPIDNNDNKFLAHLHINGKVYSESASSIKKAKTNATIKALKELFPEIAYENNVPTPDSNEREERLHATPKFDNTGVTANHNKIDCDACTLRPVEEKSSRNTSRSHSFSDFIASVVQAKYNSVVESYPEHLQRYSVLSGIVMIQNNDTTNATVICVCTGNKCLRGDHVSKEGNVLFDCHAEILSRRCLMLYLYSQLNLSLSSSNDTILEIHENGCYRVKDGVKFYLYISSAPCGDGRVFNFSPAKNPDRRKLAEKRGVLRVKLESGMGGIPVTEYMKLSPTFDDYMKGQQMVLMCCSAKLMRSNVLGTQGALLSHFLEPVYFDGILIGDIFHKGNLERALYGRVENSLLEQLPKPFRLNKPLIEGISNSKIVINVKPGKSCMNWIICEPTAEFIKTKTGKTSEDTISRLSKLKLFKRFLDIFGIFKSIELPKAAYISYHAYKESSENYQLAKTIFFEALENNSRGQWIRKSKEPDLFIVEKAELD